MWTIKGEASKAMNATARALETLRVETAQLSLATLAADQLTWTAATENATGAGTVVPAVGQVVELFYNTTRRFKGHVTAARIGTRTVSVTVEGPWWWMTRTPLTSDQTDGTNISAERASYVFPTQDLRTSLRALVDRAIENGVPMLRGAMAEMFAVPKITLAEMSCAAALGELLRWVPDAVVYFDYSGEVPELKIARRGTAASVDLTVGEDALEELNISPRLDLEVSRVVLNFVDRNPTTGKPRWQTQASGSTVAGKRQIVTVSGPEIVDFLPKDDFESVAVQTVRWTDVSDVYVLANDSGLSSIQKQFGGVFGGVGVLWEWYTGSSNAKVYASRNFPALAIRSITGETLSTATRNLVISPTPLPEWARKLLGAVEVEITGTWIAAWRDSERGTAGWNPTFIAMREGAATRDNNWENEINYGSTGPSGSDNRIDWLARPITLRGYVVKTAYTALTAVYKPWDYDYLTPPSGLAAALTAAQNWVPWEGPITLVDPAATGANLMGRKINLAGCLPECLSMGAMLSGLSYDLLGQRTTYELGAAARTDFGSLVSRIRREPKDNIVYL